MTRTIKASKLQPGDRLCFTVVEDSLGRPCSVDRSEVVDSVEVCRVLPQVKVTLRNIHGNKSMLRIQFSADVEMQS